MTRRECAAHACPTMEIPWMTCIGPAWTRLQWDGSVDRTRHPPHSVIMGTNPKLPTKRRDLSPSIVVCFIIIIITVSFFSRPKRNYCPSTETYCSDLCVANTSSSFLSVQRAIHPFRWMNITALHAPGMNDFIFFIAIEAQFSIRSALSLNLPRPVKSRTCAHLPSIVLRARHSLLLLSSSNAYE